MRIAYVCADPGVPVFGTKGSSVHVQEVVRAFLTLGAEVEIFATRLDGEVPDDLRSVGLHWLSALPKGDLALRERASLGANQGLAAALRISGPFDLVYERYSLWSFAGMEYARDSGKCGILEVNAPLIEEQEKHRGLLDRTSAERVATRAFEAATSAVVVSREVARYLERFPSIAGRVHVIPNGVNPGRFPPAGAAGKLVRPGEFTVGFLGTLKPWHGLTVLADAFSELRKLRPDVRLLIAGDGPEKDSFAAQLDQAGALDATVFTGAVTPQDVPGLLASMDAAVAPYADKSDFYFSPLKVYEYMAASLPVVVSAVGQLEELIIDGVNGLLCPPGDATALSEALVRLYDDADLRGALGTAARETVVEHHTWVTIASGILRMAGLNHDAGEPAMAVI